MQDAIPKKVLRNLTIETPVLLLCEHTGQALGMPPRLVLLLESCKELVQRLLGGAFN